MKFQQTRLAVVVVAFIAVTLPACRAQIWPAGGIEPPPSATEGGAGECKRIYSRYTPDHVLCKQLDGVCERVSSGVNSTERDHILTAHNRYRSEIALGKVVGLPPASGMLEMEWDDELAAVAQGLANQCATQPICSLCTKIEKFPVVGRASCLIHTNSEDHSSDWEACIRHMYDEDIRKVPPTISRAPLRMTSGAERLTQLAWGKTWKVGCGYAKYSSPRSDFRYDQLYICAYGPSGNVRGEDVYKVGRACSDCPDGTCCGDSCRRYGLDQSQEGLCKVTTNGPSPVIDEEGLLWTCQFNKDTSRFCNATGEPADGFQTKKFFAAGYAEAVLGSGQSAELTFEEDIRPSRGYLCAVVDFSKGPNVAGQAESGTFHLVVTPLLRPGDTHTHDLSSRPLSLLLHSIGTPVEVPRTLPQEPTSAGSIPTGVVRMQVPLVNNGPFKVGFSFAVPEGSPTQYVNIHKVAVYDKLCSR